uniref:(California timema) hypothetical protein n=1 Tax=Timema californicum TaxID=61474 RepID=A0A7R9P769_TIMCA|nr:unnamed protein product [Timema californicum]
MEVMTMLIGISTMMIAGSTAFITHGPATIDPREFSTPLLQSCVLLKDLNIWQHQSFCLLEQYFKPPTCVSGAYEVLVEKSFIFALSPLAVAKSPRSQLCLKVVCWDKKELLATSNNQRVTLAIYCPADDGKIGVMIPIGSTEGFPGRCYDAVLDMAFSPGEFWQRTKECVEYYCGTIHLNGATALHTSVNWCSKMHIRSPCKLIPGNFALQFPECCPTVKCSKVQKSNRTDLSTARKTRVTTQDNKTKLFVLRENGNVTSELKE